MKLTTIKADAVPPAARGGSRSTKYAAIEQALASLPDGESLKLLPDKGEEPMHLRHRVRARRDALTRHTSANGAAAAWEGIGIRLGQDGAVYLIRPAPTGNVIQLRPRKAAAGGR